MAAWMPVADPVVVATLPWVKPTFVRVNSSVEAARLRTSACVRRELA